MNARNMLTDRRGAVLILAFVFMVTLVVFVGAYLYLVSTGTRNANAQVNNVKAFYLSEAGLNKAVWYLNNTAPDSSMDGSWRTTGYPANPGPDANDPKQESLNGGAYVMWVEDVDLTVQITARGTFNNIDRIVRQQVMVSGGSLSIVPDSWREI